MDIKKKSFLYFILILTFKFTENSIIEEVRNCTKEIIYSYYMRGKYIQCNTAKDKYFSPEEATSQNINFVVTTGFTSSVYEELINILVPYSPTHLVKYIENRTGSPEVYMTLDQIDENLEISLYTESEPNHYQILHNKNYEEIIQHLEIGDLLLQSGTGIIVYDKIKDENGKNDIIVAYSSVGIGGGYVKTKIERNGVNYPSGDFYSNSALSIYLNSKMNENIGEEGREEGSIGLIKLSEFSQWKSLNDLNRINGKIIVFRFLNEKNGNAILRYQNYYPYFNNSKNFSDKDIIELNDKNKDRIKFKHLFIEKTVDKHHNSIVELGEFMTYQIIIKNQHSEDYTEDLTVTEYVSDLVIYKSHKENKKNIPFFEKNNGVLIWELGKLKKKEEIIIEYKVLVISGNLNDKIESKGYVGNIPSSTVFNIIGTNLNKDQKYLIKKNYDNLRKKYTGKTLINEIYKQSFKDVDIGFDKFNITDLIINDPLDYRNNSNLNLNQSNSFYNAVLNKYWSTLARIKHSFLDDEDIVNIYSLKEFNYFEKPNIIVREDFIYKETFKTGDILIYTNYNDTEYIINTKENILYKNNITYEEGEYSYIYIEGRGFVGVNYGDNGQQNTIHNRNEFSAKYYSDNELELYVQNKDSVSEEFLETANYQTLFGKDYYVILRPSLIFDLPYEEEEDESNNTWIIILFSILGLILLLVALYITWKCIKIKKSGKEINLQNFKETPLLG